MTEFSIVRIAGREFSYCPFSFIDSTTCLITGNECRFGLTDVKVPDDCPLRDKPVTITLHRTQHTRWKRAES